MKNLLSSIAAILAILLPTVASATSEPRKEGETVITLDIESGIREVPPSRVTVPAFEWVTINAPATTSGSGFVWHKNGQVLPNATETTLFVPGASPADSGIYFYGPAENSSWGGSQKVDLNIRPSTTLLNMSTRGFVGTGDQTMISGFIVNGTATGGVSTLIIRAVGPSLARFGVSGVLREPKITIYNSEGKPYLIDLVYPTDQYANKADHIQKVTQRMGLFPLEAGGKDAVDIRGFLPGAYTVHVTSGDNTTGNVLLEIYEVQEAGIIARPL